MKKRFLCLILALVTLLTLTAMAAPEEALLPAEEGAEDPVENPAESPAEAPLELPVVDPAEGPEAGPEAPEEPAEAPSEAPAAPVLCNQFAVHINEAAVENAWSLLDSGTTYVAAVNTVRAMFPACKASVSGKTTTVTGTGFAMTFTQGQKYMEINGRYLWIPGAVRVHDLTGDVMVPVRAVAQAFGLAVAWDQGGVYLTGVPTPLISGDKFYNAEDLDLISRVVQHESGNQPIEGKIGVANCILNRVAKGSRAGFANTVRGVLFQKNQFPGATNATPKAEAVIAAKLAMDGANTVGSACWFNGVGKSFWASRNKSLIIIIGGHAFYG